MSQNNTATATAAPLAPGNTHNSVATANRTARRVVLATFGAAAALAAVLSVERLHFHHSHDAASQQVLAAVQLADTILLEDERLTMSAQMAAASGESRWAERYAERLPEIDKAIAAATAMAPPAAAERFDQATRVANDRLVDMERQALAAAAAGDLGTAQGLLNSSAYAQEKERLAAGSDRFMAELQEATTAHLAAQTRHSWWALAASLLLATAACWLLWQALVRRLRRVELAFDEQQHEIERLALHDPLTGLHNRRMLRTQLEAALNRANREHSALAVLVLDLDGFKPINDRFGHAAGDAVLLEVAQRLNQQVRRGELVARLGGDEFVVVLDRCEDTEAAVRAAQRLVTALCAPIALAQAEVSVSTGVGVAFYPADGNSFEELLRKADMALYRAKAEGRGEVRFFRPAMDHEVRERERLQADLREGIASGQVQPHFQPLLSLADGRLMGYELLARWQHPVRGNVPPAVFVPVAEDSGQIDALTLCVLRAGLRAARSWADPTLTLALNIAPQQLHDEALIERLLQVLAEEDFPPQRLEVEITESALIGDLALARRIVLGLKEHGIRIALDDFGTGYSSLSHLSELPFDKIKIDRSFVATLRERRESASIVNAIVGLGRSLNVPTTAEGIEDPAVAQALAELGCNFGQGYLFAKPMPADEAAAYAERAATRSGGGALADSAHAGA